MKQAHIFYLGMVQGVGFRFTTQRLASGLGLKGWVRNLPDGRVEILAEGPEEKIKELCRQIEVHFHSYIREKTIEFSGDSGQLRNFRIIH